MKEQWQLLESEIVLSNQWLFLSKNKYQLKDGEIIDDYYVVERNDFVLVVAFRDEKLILVKQYRPATDKFYLALPAGFLQPDEDPESCAKREFLEETGYSLLDCKIIGRLDPLPGYIRSRAHIALCHVSSLPRRQHDVLEISDVVEISLLEAVRMIINGEIDEMQAVSAILLAKEIINQ